MAVAENQKAKEIDSKWYRLLYGAFILLSLYYFFIKKDIEATATTLGIALIADPFDHKLAWPKRPIWQRVWLIVHLLLVLASFAYLIIR